MNDEWKACDRPAARNKWQRVILKFVASSDDCWGKDYGSIEGAAVAARALRDAKKALRSRGEASRVTITKRGQWVYISTDEQY